MNSRAAGFATPTIPSVAMSKLSELLAPSISVALVTYILTVNVAKAVASKKDLNVNASQEFVALAFETLLASVFNGTLPSGSFSRTALLMLLNVESPLHNFVTSLFVVLVCLFMTSLLTLLPMATLAAIIFMALKSMFDIKPALFLWKVSKVEWSQWMIAFLATAILGVTWGILASIIFSVLLLLRSSAQPSTAVLGAVAGTDLFLSIKMYEQAKELPGIKIFRFDSALNFANREHFERQLAKMEIQNVNDLVKIYAVIIDCASVTSVDTSALKVVERIATKYEERNILLLFANWRGVNTSGGRVMKGLKFANVVGESHFFCFVSDAVEFAQNHHERVQEEAGGTSNTSTLTEEKERGALCKEGEQVIEMVLL